MEPIFIYYNTLKFKENTKIFTADFSDEDRLQGVMFNKNKDYYLTSLSCYIKLEENIEKLKEFPDIKKIADLSEEILRDGVEIFENDLEVSYENVKIDLMKDKSKQSQAVQVVVFFDYNLKRKRFALAYSLLNEIKKFKMKFKNDSAAGDIGTYVVRMFARKGKEYLEKEIFLNKKKVEYSIIDANNVIKSTIFFEYRNWVIPISLNITARYFNSLVRKEKRQDFYKWLYNIVFPRRNSTKKYGFTRDKTQFDNSSAFPFNLTGKTLTFQGGVKYYLTPKMYAKGYDSLIKNFTEKDAFHVNPTTLRFLRRYLPI